MGGAAYAGSELEVWVEPKAAPKPKEGSGGKGGGSGDGGKAGKQKKGKKEKKKKEGGGKKKKKEKKPRSPEQIAFTAAARALGDLKKTGVKEGAEFDALSATLATAKAAFDASKA